MIAALLLLVMLPDPKLTPGEVRPLSRATICTTKWGLDVRHVTDKMRREVLELYGFTWADHTRFTIDHLEPRSLGGADVVKNLWPQPKAEALAKDIVEKRLERQVCAGEITLAFAQAQMRTWGR